MLKLLESWIDEVNSSYQADRQSCSMFQQQFDGYYSSEFLNSSYFVVVENLPKPDFPELRELGLGDFIDNDFDGITYKDTYYLLAHIARDLRIHFHELVHVVQWRELTPIGFIQRYIQEMQTFGYGRQAPLEDMAYGLDERFHAGKGPLDVETYVRENL